MNFNAQKIKLYASVPKLKIAAQHQNTIGGQITIGTAVAVITLSGYAAAAVISIATDEFSFSRCPPRGISFQ